MYAKRLTGSMLEYIYDTDFAFEWEPERQWPSILLPPAGGWHLNFSSSSSAMSIYAHSELPSGR
jgi:hypothetical protein